MSEKYYGNYIGIVISNPALDPEGRNRAQVWVPSITNTLYEGWNNNTIDKSKKITEEMLNRLRNSLPWAECASPLIGGGAPFFANSATGISSSNPEDVVVTDDGGLDMAPESVPAGDLAADFSIPLPVSGSVPTPDTGTITDNDANNAAGSGEGMPPVEPDLPSFEDKSPTGTSDSSVDDDSTLVPSTPTGSDQTGEPIAPAQSQPSVPILNKDYTLDADSAAYKPDQKLLNDVYNTTKSVYGEGAVLNIYSAGRSGGSGRHEGGRAIDFYVTVPGQSQALAGDQLAPLVQAWRAQGYNVGFGMTPQRDGKQTGLHFDNRTDRAPKWAYSGGDDINYDEAVRKGVISPAIRAAFSAGEDGQYPDGVDPATLASSDASAPSTPSQPNDFADGNSAAPYGGAGTATGTFSTISHLAKVWVFFYGGDIQRPIYFAQVTDPSSISQELQNDPSRIDTLFA